MTSIGSILGGAFAQIRDRPLAVLVWTLIYMATTAATMIAMQPFMGVDGAALASEDPQALAQVTQMMSLLFLGQFVLLVVVSILFGAAMRATLRPHQQGFAWLRLGMDEFYLVVLVIVFTVLFFLFYLAAVVAIALGAALAGAVAGAPAAGIVAIVGIVAFILATFWLQVRFSLAFPLTLIRGKLVFGESWTVTRGHFWALFGAYFVLGLLLIILFVAVSSVTMAPYLTALRESGLSPEGLQAASEAQMAAQREGFSAAMLIGWALGGLVGGLGITLGGGAVAAAARDLALDARAVAEEFA